MPVHILDEWEDEPEKARVHRNFVELPEGVSPDDIDEIIADRWSSDFDGVYLRFEVEDEYGNKQWKSTGSWTYEQLDGMFEDVLEIIDEYSAKGMGAATVVLWGMR